MIHAGRSSLVSEYLALDDSKDHFCNNILLTMLDSEYDSSPFLRVSSNFEASSDNLEVLSQFSSGGDITRSSGGPSSVSFGSNSESVRPRGLRIIANFRAPIHRSDPISYRKPPKSLLQEMQGCVVLHQDPFEKANYEFRLLAALPIWEPIWSLKIN